jgi:hypothetical protein
LESQTSRFEKADLFPIRGVCQHSEAQTAELEAALEKLAPSLKSA